MAIWAAVLATSSSSCLSPSSPDTVRQFHDAGPVFLDPSERETWRIAHDFRISNPYSVPASVVVDAVSCGCSECVLEKSTLPPFGKTLARLETFLRYVRERSVEHADIRILAQDGRETRLRVTLACDSFPRLVTSLPRMPFEFDLSAPRISATSTIRFYVYDGDDHDTEPARELLGGPPHVVMAQRRRVKLGNGVQRHEISMTLDLGEIAQDPTYVSLSANIRYGLRSLNADIRFRHQPNCWIEPATLYLSPSRRYAEFTLHQLDASAASWHPITPGLPFAVTPLLPGEQSHALRFGIELPAEERAIPLKNVLLLRAANGTTLEVPVFVLRR